MVFVGGATGPVPAGYLSCLVTEFEGVTGKGIVVGVPRDGELWRVEAPKSVCVGGT